MTLSILNDVHIGAQRSAGTTPQTAHQLRQDLLSAFEDTLYSVDGDLMILGDLFDSQDIAKPDLLRTFLILSDWLARSSGTLYLVPGNHDLSKSSLQMSAFELLGGLLTETHNEGRVVYMKEAGMTPYGYVIPHVPNQDLFNMELEKVPECDVLYVHCNYDNGFAACSDHSLNLSKEWAEKLPVKHIVFAHEHQGGTELGGKVAIIGNQFPSSVSDCLGNMLKNRLVVDVEHTSDTTAETHFTYVTTWEAEGDFSEQNWRELKDTGRFIRVVGDATAGEADDVARTLAKFRSQAKALVITNAVRVEGFSDNETLVLTHEEVTNFNVREALREYLTPEENQKVDALLAPAPEKEKEAA